MVRIEDFNSADEPAKFTEDKAIKLQEVPATPKRETRWVIREEEVKVAFLELTNGPVRALSGQESHRLLPLGAGRAGQGDGG
jgi:hypothetical protein